MRFSLDDIKNSPCGPLNPHLFEKPEKKKNNEVSKIKKRNKTKEWVEKNIWAWCRANSFEMRVEYRFHGKRKWRFDFFIEELKVAIEYEGIVSNKSRHTTLNGYTGDSEKYNEAAKMGIIVLRYTALNYKNLLPDLIKLKNDVS